MTRFLAAVAMMVLVVSCGDSTLEPVPTAEPPPTPTTAAPVTTQLATTTTSTSTSTTTTTLAAATHDAVVAWDGTTCSYEGPAEIPAGDTLNILYRNDSADVADYEVAYLITGHTIEELVEVTGSFIDRETSTVPEFINIVAGYPDGIGSLGSGEEASVSQQLATPRLHTFTCFGGRQTGDQTVGVAATGVTVTE